MSKDPADTARIPSLSDAKGRSRPLSYSSGLTVDVAGLSHQGHVRTNNEDCFLICRYGRHLQVADSNLPPDESPNQFEENGCAMCIADGMGGHQAGEVASRLAINSLMNFALTTPDWIFRFDDEDMASKAMKRAVDHVLNVKDVLALEAELNPSLRGFGTTLALAWGVGQKLFILHVDDSRVYLFRAGQLQQLTRDHTVAQDLATGGFIAENQVAKNLFRHHLTQCLNPNAAKVQPDVRRIELQDGDLVLLCTDG